jgi:Fe-S cluster assembly protein SufB
MTGAPAVEDIVKSEYEHGFTTEIESDTLPPGLDEEVVRAISQRKGEPEFMTEQRLKAYRHWLTLREPEWAAVDYPKIDFQSISYYSAPKRPEDMPKSLDEIDPVLLETYNKLGIPIEEQKALAGIAVDAVFDSVSVATTFRSTLAEAGVIFCSISEALHDYPELVKPIWARSYPTPTTSTPVSTRPCSATAPSSMCPRACAARWS